MSWNRKTVNVTDPNFEECVLRWFDESDVEFSDQDRDSASNISIENAIASDHETAMIETGEDSDVSDPGKKYMYGKNRYKWAATEPTRNVRTPAHNILKLPGNRYKWAATEPTRNVRTPAHNILKLPGNRNALPTIEALKAWQQIFSQDILDIVVYYTNLKIQEFRKKADNQNRTEYRDTI
ncbi:hypothetical protein QE152_g27385 [Popillia japonica]|uniref:Uncharacterized protein n=1 Tax=Popillia japonica TaxID=7064 RepID=A0AAW1JT37_POPJA